MSDAQSTESFGDYIATKRLGSGGQATAWLAHHKDSPDESLLLKTFHVGVAQDWKVADLFERSARVLERLDHEMIPAYRDHFHLELPGSEVLLCLVREYVPGESLQDRLDKSASFDEDELIDLTLWMLEVLEYLHGQVPPIIHRDIKPANIIIDTSGKPRLVDFGAVQADVLKETGGSTIVGTAGYVAPEQLMGLAQPPSDLYALGMTILYLATGTPPTELPSDGFEVELPEDLAVSPGLGHVLRRITRADIDVRAHDIGELTASLERLKGGQPLVVRGSTLPVKLPEGSRFIVQEATDGLIVRVPRQLRRLRGTGGKAGSANLTRLVIGGLVLYTGCFIALEPALFASGILWMMIAIVVALGVVYAVTLGPNEILLALANDRLTLKTPTYMATATRDTVRAGDSYVAARESTGRLSLMYAEIDSVRVSRWSIDDALTLVFELKGNSGPRRVATAAFLSHGEHIWLLRLIEARLEQYRELHPDA